MSKSAPLFLGLTLMLALPLPLAQAADARWFRYLDDKRQPVVTDTVTSDHITRGYDELTASFQVIRHVDARPVLNAAQQAAQRGKREASLKQAQNDKQLLRLYSGPADAERLRNRQLDGLQTRIEAGSSTLASLQQRRAAETQKAAGLERSGKPVPPDVKEAIAGLDKQVQAQQADLEKLKAEQTKVQAEFDATIQRLAELTGRPAGTAPWTPAPKAVAPKP